VPPTPVVPQIPSFGRPVTHDLVLEGGRVLRFHEVSARALLRLEAVADRLKAAALVLLSEGQTNEQRLDAMLDVFKTAGADPELVGYLILDALRAEEWNTVRPPGPLQVDRFLAAVDGSTLVLMIGALAAVNLKAAVPLLQRLVGTASAEPDPTSPVSGSAGSGT
jgi:hypothetical protein